MLTLSDSRLGGLGWHTNFTSEGVPVDDNAFEAFGKVCESWRG